jgi:hypothetical protein
MVLNGNECTQKKHEKRIQEIQNVNKNKKGKKQK